MLKKTGDTRASGQTGSLLSATATTSPFLSPKMAQLWFVSTARELSAQQTKEALARSPGLQVVPLCTAVRAVKRDPLFAAVAATAVARHSLPLSVG